MIKIFLYLNFRFFHDEYYYNFTHTLNSLQSVFYIQNNYQLTVKYYNLVLLRSINIAQDLINKVIFYQLYFQEKYQ